jgi:hypothetical protein
MRRFSQIAAIFVLATQLGCGWDLPEIEKASLKKGFMKPNPPKFKWPPPRGIAIEGEPDPDGFPFSLPPRK